MHFTTVLVAALAAAMVSAAPAPVAQDEPTSTSYGPESDMEMDSTTTTSDLKPRAASWALKDFSRRCDGGSCTFSYSIFDGQNTASCYYKSAGPKASYSTTCGKYAVTSAWSEQFGADKGFSTMSVTKNGKTIYPSYSDAEVAGGKVVKPDHSYVPAVVA